MRALTSKYLSPEENDKISSILEEEESELKDGNFYTQSNISALDEQSKQIWPNWDPTVHQSPANRKNKTYDPQGPSLIHLSQPNQQDFSEIPQKYKKESKYNNNMPKTTPDFNKNNSNENNNSSNYDMANLKNEVEDLMSYVRSAVRTGKSPSAIKNRSTSDSQLTANSNRRSPQQNSQIPDGKLSSGYMENQRNAKNNYSSTQSPFMFQSGRNSQFSTQNQNSQNLSPQNRYSQVNSNVNIDYNSYFSTNNTPQSPLTKNNDSYASLHVEFPDFPRNPISPTRNPSSPSTNPISPSVYQSKFNSSRNYKNEEFILTAADFPQEPQILQKGRYSTRKIDTSKEDSAQIDNLRKENISLKAELLKIEKRLQLEEEEHKKLLVSLEKSEKLRAVYKAKLEQNK